MLQYRFKKKTCAFALSTSAVRVKSKALQIYPELVFHQRLDTPGTQTHQLYSNFAVPAVFEAIHVMMPAYEHGLADATYAFRLTYVIFGPTGQILLVLSACPWHTE